MMAKRSIEPLLWLLFSAGGVVAALLTPMLALLFGLAFPLGWLPPPSHAHVLAVIGHPLARSALFLFCVLSLFHWAHRFRFTLMDLGLHGMSTLLAIVCYGSAIVGTVTTAWLLFSWI